MHNLNKLHIYTLARHIVVEIHTLRFEEFGDLHNQIQRASISIVSNIAEGAGSTTDKQFAKYLGYAKASCNEVIAQLTILTDFDQLDGQHTLFTALNNLAGKLTNLSKRLRSG